MANITTDLIEDHKTQTDEGIKKKSFNIGVVLCKISRLNKELNGYVTLLEIFKKRREALEGLTPDRFFEDYYDKYFETWEKVEYSKDMLNRDIILGFLSEELTPAKYLQVLNIIEVLEEN